MTSLKFFYLFAVSFLLKGCMAEEDPWAAENRTQTLVWQYHIGQGEYVDLYCSEYAVWIGVNCTFVDVQEIERVKELILVDKYGNPFDNPGCTARKVDDEYYKFSLEEYFAECSCDIVVEGDYLHVRYSVQIVPQFLIGQRVTRDDAVYIHFSCIYYKKADVTADLVVQPNVVRKRFIVGGNRAVEGELRMERYTDVTFSAVNSDLTAVDGEIVYVGISLDVSGRFSIQLDGLSCWVTREADGSALYTIVEDSCPTADPFISGANVIYQNYDDSFHFSLTSFHWRDSLVNQYLFIHCHVRLCENSLGSCPTEPTCPPTRKRRSAEKTDPLSVDMHTLTIGPISVVQPKDDATCNRDDMGCDFDCAVGNHGKRFCVCPSGTVLNFDGKTCSNPTEVSDPIEQDVPNLWIASSTIIGIFAFVATIFVIAALVTVCVRSRQKS